MNKILEIDQTKIDGYGDCLSVCLMKIFKYYKKVGFEFIYQHDLEIDFYSKLDDNGLYDLRNCMTINSPKYFDLIKKYFNIKVKTIENACNSDIIQALKNGIPVIINILASSSKWTGRSLTNDDYHIYIINGYNQDESTFICTDSYYTNLPQALPFAALDNYTYNLFLTDFNEFEEMHIIDLKEDMKLYIDSFKDNIASNVLTVFMDCIKHNINTISNINMKKNMFDDDPNNLFIYALPTSDVLELSGRIARFCGFFNYLFDKYRFYWLNEIFDLYKKYYKSTRVFLMLMLKYNFTYNNEVAQSLLQVGYEFHAIESEIFNILTQRGCFRD